MSLSPASIDILSNLLLKKTGQKLTEDRAYRLVTALSPLARQHNCATVDMLVARLVGHEGSDLADAVVEASLNNETYFFRDGLPFDLIDRKVLSKLRAARASQRAIRIWCAGVSNGQEAYSLAMLFDEQRSDWQGWSIEIVATDVSSAALDRARAGVYTHFEVQRGLSVERLLRYFEKRGNDWVIDPRLRERIRFSQHNLLSAIPPLVRADLVLCRNVLLYFSRETQGWAFNCLSKPLAADGALVLGAGETVLGLTDRFMPDREAPGLYRPLPAGEAARLSDTG